VRPSTFDARCLLFETHDTIVFDTEGGTVRRVLRPILPVVRLSDREWSALDTFDSLAPVSQSTHDAAEVRRWLKQSRLAAMRQTAWGATAYRGVSARAGIPIGA
jgi:hypothetical protein